MEYFNFVSTAIQIATETLKNLKVNIRSIIYV